MTHTKQFSVITGDGKQRFMDADVRFRRADGRDPQEPEQDIRELLLEAQKELRTGSTIKPEGGASND